jgi:Fur family ferric uptake transcriptional regulator/Fur family zinc uptake transcriptional regulator
MTATVGERLRAAGLRRTPSRLAVFGRIEALARPISHGELKEERELSEVDDITLYRTLSTLVEAGLLHRVHGIDGVWRYCAQPEGRAGCPGNHAHFLCTACGSMTCLLAQPIPRVDLPAGAAVHGRHFILHGQCAECAVHRTGPHHGHAP